MQTTIAELNCDDAPARRATGPREWSSACCAVTHHNKVQLVSEQRLVHGSGVHKQPQTYKQTHGRSEKARMAHSILNLLAEPQLNPKPYCTWFVPLLYVLFRFIMLLCLDQELNGSCKVHTTRKASHQLSAARFLIDSQ